MTKQIFISYRRDDSQWGSRALWERLQGLYGKENVFMDVESISLGCDLAESIFETMPVDEYPHLMELTTEHVLQPGYDFGNEFEFGLNLILDGLDIASKTQ